jgi:protein involved in polysaccharide export with SLBB domain
VPTRSPIAAAVVWLLCAGGVSSALGTAGDEPIRVGDVVEFRISGVRGASVVTVDDDGCVTLPTVGTVNVAGLTADEAADSVSRAYWDLGITAEVAATVLDSPATVLGAPTRRHARLRAPPVRRRRPRPLHHRRWRGGGS